MPFPILAAALLGGALLGGAVIQSSAASKAAKTQSNAALEAAKVQSAAADKSLALQKYQYDTTRGDFQPYREAGVNALTTLGDPTKLAAGFKTDPGYQFALDEGRRTLEGSAASRGTLQSGSTLKALTRYGQGMADQQYGLYYNRLANLAGIGQQATGSTAQAGQNYATGGSNALAYGADARAGGIVGAGNARSSGYIGTANAFSGALNSAATLGAYGYGQDWFKPKPPVNAMYNTGF